MVNHNSIKVGQVLYYAEKDKQSPYMLNIRYGIVEDMYTDGVVLTNLTQYENRFVNGVPYNKLVTPTKWNKLPKNWTYNTELFKLECRINEEFNNLDFDARIPETILHAYEVGALIPAEKKDWSHIETEIDKVNGYRLIRKTYYGEYHPSTTTLSYSSVYQTYQEVKNHIGDVYAEILRQQNLSDYDWSLEHIEKDIDRYLAMSYVDKDVRMEMHNKLKNWFVSKEKLEDIETRISGGLQWKYCDNKKWNDIDENNLV